MIILPDGFELGNNPLIGYHNLVTRSNVTADEETATAPATQLATPATYNPWAGVTTAEQSVQINLGESLAVNYFGIARHNFATAEITYHVEHSPDGAAWTDLGDVTPATDGVIMHLFEETEDQFWRIRMESGSLPPTIAVWYVGLILQVPRRIYVDHTPIDFGRQLTISNGRSENGQFLGRVVRRRVFQSDVKFANLTPDWYRQNFEAFVAAAEEIPFFWGWRPEDYPEECGYVWPTRDIVPTNQRANGMMQVGFPFEGIIE